MWCSGSTAGAEQLVFTGNREANQQRPLAQVRFLPLAFGFGSVEGHALY